MTNVQKYGPMRIEKIGAWRALVPTPVPKSAPPYHHHLFHLICAPFVPYFVPGSVFTPFRNSLSVKMYLLEMLAYSFQLPTEIKTDGNKSQSCSGLLGKD